MFPESNGNVSPLEPLVKEVHDLKVHVHPPVPNPAPLGLIGFGLTTALLQLKHTRLGGEESDDLEGVDTVVMGFAMFFGGLLQVSAIDTHRQHWSNAVANVF